MLLLPIEYLLDSLYGFLDVLRAMPIQSFDKEDRFTAFSIDSVGVWGVANMDNSVGVKQLSEIIAYVAGAESGLKSNVGGSVPAYTVLESLAEPWQILYEARCSLENQVRMFKPYSIACYSC